MTAKFPWVRHRIDRYALVVVPEGWTLDWRDGEDVHPIRPPVRFVDGDTATIPPGLGDIRIMPGVRKGAVDYWARHWERERQKEAQETSDCKEMK